MRTILVSTVLFLSPLVVQSQHQVVLTPPQLAERTGPWSVIVNLSASSFYFLSTLGGSYMMGDHHSIGLGAGFCTPLGYNSGNFIPAANLEYTFYFLKVMKNTVSPFLAFSMDYFRNGNDGFYYKAWIYPREKWVSNNFSGQIGAGFSCTPHDKYTVRLSASYFLARYHYGHLHTNDIVSDMPYEYHSDCATGPRQEHFRWLAKVGVGYHFR